MKRGRAIVWILGGLLLAGCGKGGGTSAGPAQPQNGDSQVKRRAAADLPAVGDYLPPQDDGGNKIEIAPPADWKPMPRDARFLARFVKGNVSELPRITVEAWDSPVPEITELTEENADRLAAALVKQLKQDKKTVPEPPRPIVLGDTIFLRHVRRARLPSGGHVVVQALETVRGGRIYTVELIADIDAARAEEYEASLKKWRDFGYAVAANLKFGGAGETTTETPAPEPSAESPAPAATNP
jgi:hypothetical protein